MLGPLNSLSRALHLHILPIFNMGNDKASERTIGSQFAAIVVGASASASLAGAPLAHMHLCRPAPQHCFREHHEDLSCNNYDEAPCSSLVSRCSTWALLLVCIRNLSQGSSAVTELCQQYKFSISIQHSYEKDHPKIGTLHAHITLHSQS